MEAAPWVEILGQLAAIVSVIYLLIQYLSKRDIEFVEYLKSKDHLSERMATEGHSAVREMNTVIKENTSAILELKAAIELHQPRSNKD